MEINLTLGMIFVCLVLLLLFYYIDLESNIIVLLGVVIVLQINNLILKTEHFETKKVKFNNSCLVKNILLDSNKKCI